MNAVEAVALLLEIPTPLEPWINAVGKWLSPVEVSVGTWPVTVPAHGLTPSLLTLPVPICSLAALSHCRMIASPVTTPAPVVPQVA
jgi:hypothetical protein